MNSSRRHMWQTNSRNETLHNTVQAFHSLHQRSTITSVLEMLWRQNPQVFDPQMPDPALELKCWPKKQGTQGHVLHALLSGVRTWFPRLLWATCKLQRQTEALSGQTRFVAVVFKWKTLVWSGKWYTWNPVSNFVLDSHLNFWKKQKKISVPRSGMKTDK